MIRVVSAVVERFYKVYVEDENDDMTDTQILAKAKEMILENEMDLDDELDIESDDIRHMEYLYDLED